MTIILIRCIKPWSGNLVLVASTQIPFRAFGHQSRARKRVVTTQSSRADKWRWTRHPGHYETSQKVMHWQLKDTLIFFSPLSSLSSLSSPSSLSSLLSLLLCSNAKFIFAYSLLFCYLRAPSIIGRDFIMENRLTSAGNSATSAGNSARHHVLEGFTTSLDP